MKKSVLISFEIEGFHYWKEAYEKVSFLKNNHRHLFIIRAGFQVSELDREIEIFDKTWEIKNYLKNKYKEPCMFAGMSCEMIALEIFEKFHCLWVEVLEDGQGGARIDC